MPLAFKVKLSGSNFVPIGWLRFFGKRLVQIITPGSMPPDNIGNLRVAKTISGSTQQIQMGGSRIDHLQNLDAEPTEDAFSRDLHKLPITDAGA